VIFGIRRHNNTRNNKPCLNHYGRDSTIVALSKQLQVAEVAALETYTTQGRHRTPAGWQQGRDTQRTTLRRLRRLLVRGRRKICLRRNCGVVAREVLRQALDRVDMPHRRDKRVRYRIGLRLRILTKAIAEDEVGMAHSHSIAMTEVDMGEVQVGQDCRQIRRGQARVHRVEGMEATDMGNNHSLSNLVDCRGSRLGNNR